MTLQKHKKGMDRPKKTRISKKKGSLRKTKKNGGGLFNFLATTSRVGVGIRNIKYKDTLENRLVNKYNDYEWVQSRRSKNMLPRKDKSEYTENDWTSDNNPSAQSNNTTEEPKNEPKKGWFW
jgi:hypothetical protein